MSVFEANAFFWRTLLKTGLVASITCCSPNEGTGNIRSEKIFAPGCFTGPFDLKPNFFTSNPFRDTQTLRIQHGDDIAENSDGINILVDSTLRVRQQLGKTLRVGLPPEVTPPGTLMVPQTDPPPVHITFYLNETCHGQNISLYALDGTITFNDLFDGDPNQRKANEKFTRASFNVTVGDPRDAPIGGGAIPAERTSRLIGNFQFYFQRGQPGQPFP